jgi:hypothetical protein
MVNAWMNLVKKISAENKGKSLREILKLAESQFKMPNNKTHKRKKASFRKSRSKK